MKKLLIATTLFLSIFNVNSAFADDDYMTDENGYYIYVGSCVLHEDYEGKKYDINEVVPYIEYPSSDFVRNLPAVYEDLIKAVYMVELGPYLEGDFYRDLDEFSFDDISIDQVTLHGSNETLYRVSYGVGGGNGGYTTFRINADDSLEELARTFDGELLECSAEFN